MSRSAPPPRRILMTADAIGGVWTYALELGRGLGARGCEVLLATMGGPVRPEQSREAAAIPGLRLVESSYRLEWMDEPWEDLARAADWLLGLEAEFCPDVIHLNGYALAALPWQAPVVVVAHSCVLSWWRAVHGGAAPETWDNYATAVRRGLAAADVVIAPTQAMLGALRSEHGAVPRARVIPNGRDPALFTPAPKENVILSVGRLWDEAKNVRTLAAVAPHLSWPVRVAGEATRPGGRRVPLAGVEVLGSCPPDQLAAHHARAAIFALPARYEPFGLSALEAALAGCALVLGDIPSLREVWGDAAVFVPPADAVALRVALAWLISDPLQRQALGARARERALHYTPARMTAAYLAAYTDARHPARTLPRSARTAEPAAPLPA